MGAGRGMTSDLGPVPEAPVGEVIVEEQRRLALGRWALERSGGDPDDHVAATELGQDMAKGKGTGHGVELVATLHQSRGSRRVEVGAEGHDQDVVFERAGVGLDSSALWVDRPDRALHEPHPWLHQIGVGMENGGTRGPPEHHIELGETEDEPIGFVYEHDLDGVAPPLGQPRGQLQDVESCTL